MSGGWLEQFRGLGAAALDLVGAEAKALARDFQGSGRRLAGALLLLLAGLAAAFWACAALVYGLVEVLVLWLPRWGAALAVCAAFLLLAMVLALWARSRLRAIEPPAATVRRRLGDSSEWWQERVASGAPRASLDQGEEE